MYQYQVSFGDAIKRAFSNYCVFTGRASRSEYWWFALFMWLVSVIIGYPSMMASFAAIGSALNGHMVAADAAGAGAGFFGYVNYVWNLAVLLPSLGLLFRRLHDAGHSGWNILWAFFPIVGWIVLLVYLCQESQMFDNQYGPVPNMTA